MKKGMRESYIEDLASHGGPDHALATREGAAKRWTGVHAGRIFSLEMVLVRDADALMHVEGNTVGRVIASGRRVPRGRRTRARVRSLHAENREISRLPSPGDDAPSWMVRGVACRW